MPATQYLRNLSAEVQDEIVEKFGSPEELIIKLISLAVLDHKVIEEKPEFHEILSMEIRYELFDITDKLDEINLDGAYIVEHVLTDFRHATRSFNMASLDEYFHKLGITEIKKEAVIDYYMRAFSYSVLENAIARFFGQPA